LKAILGFDHVKLSEVLNKASQSNLVLSNKEYQILQELVQILEPFAEATDVTQGDKSITISCVVPVIVSLDRILSDYSMTIKFLAPMVRELHNSLFQRFRGLFVQLSIPEPRGFVASDRCRDLNFDSRLFLLAAALDPHHSFQWLVNHPGSCDEKSELRNQITGIQKIIMEFDVTVFVCLLILVSYWK
jgi:hypothetical protein